MTVPAILTWLVAWVDRAIVHRPPPLESRLEILRRLLRER